MILPPQRHPPIAARMHNREDTTAATKAVQKALMHVSPIMSTSAARIFLGRATCHSETHPCWRPREHMCDA